MPKLFRAHASQELFKSSSGFIRSFKCQFDNKGPSVVLGTTSSGKVKENFVNYYKNMHLLADLAIRNNSILFSLDDFNCE